MKKTLLILTIAICSINCFAQLPSWLPQNGLVAWYPFTGNAQDSSGNNYNGIDHGATLTKDRFGNIRSAYKFSGNEYIEIPFIEPFVAQSHTISCWMKSTQTTLGRLIVLPTSIFGGKGAQHFSLNLNIDSLYILIPNQVAIYFDKINTPVPFAVAAFSKSSPNDNNWHNVIGVIDSANLQMRIYLDGNLENEINYDNGPTSYATDYLQFGRFSSDYPDENYYIGILDDVAIYNRVLNSNEIQQLYCACTKPSISISNKTIFEGNSGTKQLKFSVTLSNTYTSPVKIKYKTSNNTANAGTDYIRVIDSLVFNPGQTSKTISVTINGDTKIEPDETFYVSLFKPVNATIANDTAIGKIRNDDGVALSNNFGTSENINSKSLEADFKIFPNPVKDMLYIQTKNNAIFYLSDAKGKLLLSKQIQTNGSVNVSGLPAGLYFLKNNLKGEVQKVVIEK